MCGAIPVPCDKCGVFWRIVKLCECNLEEGKYDLESKQMC